MGRSGYSDDWDGEGAPPDFYQNSVKRALAGKRGQVFLQELAREMDAMPVKRLISEELIDAAGGCCAMGVVLKARGIDVSEVDYYDRERVAALINIAPAMAGEIAYMNDDDFGEEGAKDETPEQRWARIREWVRTKLVDPP